MLLWKNIKLVKKEKFSLKKHSILWSVLAILELYPRILYDLILLILFYWIYHLYGCDVNTNLIQIFFIFFFSYKTCIFSSFFLKNRILGNPFNVMSQKWKKTSNNCHFKWSVSKSSIDYLLYDLFSIKMRLGIWSDEMESS